MKSSRIPSPARSQGVRSTPRRQLRSTRSVGSPARSTTSLKLSTVIQMESLVFSPMPTRRSILTDTTQVDVPTRRSWWKKLDENSRELMEVLNSQEPVETDKALEEYIDVDVLSQEKKNYTLDLPESSDGESISSIVIPQRILFTQKENQPKDKFGKMLNSRESLPKLHKSQAVDEKSINVNPKNLFNLGTNKRKPIFPSALLNISINKSIQNKAKELHNNEAKGEVRNLFGNRVGVKRKNMFADFIVSESEDDISDIQPKIFGFQKKVQQKRRTSLNQRNGRESSPAASITDSEMDDWRLLPSSTMVDHQLEDGHKTGPSKRTRLSRSLSDAREVVNSANRLSKLKKIAVNELIDPETSADEIDAVSYNHVNANSDRSDVSSENLSLKKSVQKQSSKIEEHSKCKGKVEITKNVAADLGNNKTTKANPKTKSMFSNKSMSKIDQALQSDDDDEDFTLIYDNDDNDLMEQHKENETVLENQTQHLHDNLNHSIALNSSISNKLQHSSKSQSVAHDRSRDHNKEIKKKDTNKRNDSKTSGKKYFIQHTNDSIDEDDETEAQQRNVTLKTSQKDKSPNNINHNKEQNEKTETVCYELQSEVDENQDKQNNELIRNSNEHREVQNGNNNNTKEKTNNNENYDNSTDDRDEIQDKYIKDKRGEKANDIEGQMNDISDNKKSYIQNSEEGKNVTEKVQYKEARIAVNIEEKMLNDDSIQNKSHKMDICSKEIKNDEHKVNHENVGTDSEKNVEIDKTKNIDNENQEKEEIDYQEHAQTDNEEDEHSDKQENIKINDEGEEIDNHENMENNSCNIDMDQSQGDKDVNQKEVDNENKINECKNNDNQDQPNTEEAETTHNKTSKCNNDDEPTVPSPEIPTLQNKINQIESFTVEERNTSIRKTKSMVKSLNIQPSLMHITENSDLSDIIRNSSAEGSGWDSHRTTRVTLRRTFGKDFTPRKSLRTLVMEKSTKRQTNFTDINVDISKFPQANSTELPQPIDMDEDDVVDAQESPEIVVDDKESSESTNEVNVQDSQKSANEVNIEESHESTNEVNEQESYQSADEIDEQESHQSTNEVYKQESCLSADEMDEQGSHESVEIDVQNESGDESELHESADEVDVQESQESADEVDVQESQESADEVDVQESQESADEVDVQESQESADEVDVQESQESADEIDVQESQESANETDIQESQELANEVDEQESQESADEVEVEESHESVNDINVTDAQKSHDSVHYIDEQQSHENDDEIDVQQAQDSYHEVPQKTRQTTLFMYLQNIKDKNIERKKQLEEQIRSSLNIPKRDIFNPFKVPAIPKQRRPKAVQSKAKAKPVKASMFSQDMLPSELLEDMQYKPPKRYRPPNASWITKRLYKFLETKLEPKYDYKARVRSEKLVEKIYEFTKGIRRHSTAPRESVAELKHEMARLGIVKTHFDFHQFFHDYMPREVRLKVVPDAFNKIPEPKHGVFSDILR